LQDINEVFILRLEINIERNVADFIDSINGHEVYGGNKGTFFTNDQESLVSG
jgi:hypothetical protein